MDYFRLISKTLFEETLGGFAIQRMAEQISLSGIASDAGKLMQLRLGFDAFGHHAHPQIVRQIDDAADTFAGFRIRRDAAHEGPVNLEAVEMKRSKVTEEE